MFRSVWKRALLIAGGIAFLANCGGGGSIATPFGALQPIANSSSAAAQGAQQQVSVRLKISSPGVTSSAVRNAQFVSPGTEDVVVQVFTSPQSTNPNVVASSTTDVSSGSAACGGVSGTRTCTINIPAPAGLDDFVFTTYDQPPVSNAIPSTAHVLAVGRVTQTIVTAQTNVVSVALSGTIVTLTVQPLIQSLPSGVAGSYPLAITGLDADGFAVIAGSTDPYSNPITVTVSESNSSGSTHVTTNGSMGTSNSSVMLHQSTDTATVLYNGGGTSGYSAQLTVSSQNVTSVVVQFDPLFVSPAQVTLAVGASQTVSISRSGFVGTFTFPAFNCPTSIFEFSGSAASFVNVTATGSIQITATGSGTCTFNVSDGMSSVPVTVTVPQNATTSVTIPGAATFNYTGTPTTFSVPATGVYQIVALGAQGGNSAGQPRYPEDTHGIGIGGLGAQITGDFILMTNDVLSVFVGGQGASGTGGGGGGGSFIYDTTTHKLLVAAGGGGGAGLASLFTSLYDGQNALTISSGATGESTVYQILGYVNTSPLGGINGMGGSAGPVDGGGGGGGFLTAGAAGLGGDPYYDPAATGGGGGGAYVGLAGGPGGSTTAFDGAYAYAPFGPGGAGGFGGGGGGAFGGGGGGGYSGGGGGNGAPGPGSAYGGGGGGGGGSYLDTSATARILTAGAGSGSGQVSIAQTKTGS